MSDPNDVVPPVPPAPDAVRAASGVPPIEPVPATPAAPHASPAPPVEPAPPAAPVPPPVATPAPAAPASVGPAAAPVPPATPVPPAYGAQPYPPAQPYSYGPTAPPQGLSITSMILGISGLVLLFFWIGLLPSIAAVITGHLAQRSQPHARGFWLTGLITGYIGVGLAVLGILAFVAFFLFAGLLSVGAR